MVSLLYHWNFTGDNNLEINEEFLDSSESNLKAKVKRRGTYDNSSFSRSDDGIYLNNSDSTNGGYYIDLEGLNDKELGGNITIEMAVKNKDRSIKSLYFVSVGEKEINGDDINQAAINARFNGLKSKTFFSVRSDFKNDTSNDITGGVDYELRNASENSTTVISDDQEYHYIFSVDYDDIKEESSLKIYINGDKKGENTADLEKSLITDARNSNLIGTRKEAEDATYFNGVIKYLKIYQNSITDSEASSIYNNYNDYVYLSDYSGKTPSEIYQRRHSTINSYFSGDTTSFIILGNQLGMSNGLENYKVYKFTNESEIIFDNKYNYLPLQDKDNYIIVNYNSTYFKITQTSTDSNINSKYKCEISIGNKNNFVLKCENKGFGDTYSYNNINIVFGGLEFIINNEICFHENTLIDTDQGKFKIKDLTPNNTIQSAKIIHLIKSSIKYKDLVLIEKNSIDNNIPSEDIILTKNHLLLINNKVVSVNKLINNEKIKIIYDCNSYVYNMVLLNKNFIKINNLIVNVFSIDSNLYQKLLDNNLENVSLPFDKNSIIHLNLNEFKNF